MKKNGNFYLFVLPVLLILLVVSTFFTYQYISSRKAISHIYSELSSSAANQAYLMRALFESRMHSVAVAAGCIDAAETSDEELLILEALTAETDFSDAYITEASSDLSGARSNSDFGISYSGSLSGEKAFLAYNTTSDRRRLLSAELSSDHLRSKLINRTYSGNAFSFICDSDGYVIIGSENGSGFMSGENLLSILQTEYSSEEKAEGFSDLMSYTVNGEQSYAVCAPLNLNGWTIVNAVRSDIADAYTGQSILDGFMLTVIIITFSLCFMLFVYIMNKKQNNRLVYITEHDSMTGLINRHTFISQAGELIRKAPPNSLSVHCIDIEGFRFVNDQFGHSEGDRLLKHMASCLHRSVTDAGGIVCRDSVDTFISLLPNLPNQLEITESFCHDNLLSYDLPFKITVRIGACVVNDPDAGIKNYIDHAMLALRIIKNDVIHHSAFYDHGLHERMLREQRIAEDMERALERGEFEVFFQPQFDIADMSIIGAEALVRWNHPEHGMIPPGEFIPVFEKNGFILRLDYYIWEKVCSLLHCWKDKGLTVPPVSVNVSRFDICESDLNLRISGLTQKYGIDCKQLRLEITESAYTESPERITGLVDELQALGFLVEMDDFGKGYSSLHSLKNIPVDLLKLDMDFISDSGKGQRGLLILKTIMDMARQLDIPVIAEGVENDTQLNFLRSVGCCYVQGYLFSRPIPAEEFEKKHLCVGQLAV